MKTALLWFIAAFCTLLPVSGQKDSVSAQPPKEKTSKRILPLFDSDEPLKVTLRFNLTQFLKKNLKTKSYDGVLTFHFSDSDILEREITVKHRGVFRLENCNFPPLQINFKKPVYVLSDSDKVKKIKLVTHCQTSLLYDEYVLREYLVYKLYNVLTDSSFRVRLLRVTYLDTEKDRKPVVQYGIFIEPEEILARRTNSALIKATNLNQSHIVPEAMVRLAIFNYMVANWDWSIPGQHNISIIKPLSFKNPGLGVAVPYDFDLTGIVNAEYAVTSPETGLKNIRERRFQGMCYDKAVYQEALKEYLIKKEKLYSVVNGFSLLNPKAKKDITSYLDSFFDQLSIQRSTDQLIFDFLNNCKKL